MSWKTLPHIFTMASTALKQLLKETWMMEYVGYVVL
jgi:hypothetical protein